MALEDCIPLEIPPLPPGLNIPGYGELQALHKDLNSVADPGEMIANLMTQLGVALAPIKRYIQMLDAMMAVKDCMQAIPRAIISLSPDPIYDCFKNLGKAIAVLMSYIPPMAYVRMGCDIAKFCTIVIAELVSIFEDFDERLTQYISAWNSAVARLDTDLQAQIQCSALEVKALMDPVFPIIKAIGLALEQFIEFMLRFYPAFKEVAKVLSDELANLDEIQDAIETGATYLPDPDKTQAELEAEAAALHQLVPVPPLGKLFEGLTAIHNAAVVIYNTLAPTVGLDPDLRTMTQPTFNNF